MNYYTKTPKVLVIFSLFQSNSYFSISKCSSSKSQDNFNNEHNISSPKKIFKQGEKYHTKIVKGRCDSENNE